MDTSRDTGSGRHVVVAGGSFAALGAAYTVREALPPTDRVTVVAPNHFFVFAPSLVWAALGASPAHSSFPLEAALAAKGIEFINDHVRAVGIEDHMVRTDGSKLYYDRLIVATGGRPDTEAIPGIAGEFRQASWIVGEDSAMEARNAVRWFFNEPGPLLVGAAQGAAYISGAYELALALDAELRRRGLRERVPLTFVTGEPYLGHLDIGQSAAHAYLAALFSRRNIDVRAGVSIDRVSRRTVELSSGESLESRLSIIMPPFTGAVDIWKSAELTDTAGMIPVTAEYRHAHHPDIYAAGVASYFQQPVQPLGCIRPPATGYLSLRMGTAAGRNVAASLGYGTPTANPLPAVLDVRVINGVDTGVLLMSRGRTQLHHSARRLPGGSARVLKRAIERYLLWRLREGRMNLP